jgi:type VI secretion system protein ImpK
MAQRDRRGDRRRPLRPIVDDLTEDDYAGDEPVDERDRESGRPAPADRDRRGGGRDRSRGRIAFEDADDDTGGHGGWDEPTAERVARDPYETRRRPRRAARAERPPALMDLCTPLFAFASLIPREAGDTQPSYAPFREQVMGGLQTLARDAETMGIDRQDAQEASFALSVLLDELVAKSEWLAKTQWMQEPLGRTLHNDPQGGVTFFDRLSRLEERQKEVKAVYLVCLALGFEGKFAELDPAIRREKVAEIRLTLLRAVHPEPADRLRRLFPDAYRPAYPIEEPRRPMPGWVLATSIAAIVVSLVIYGLLLWWASVLSTGPSESLQRTVAATAAGTARGEAGR